MTTLKTRLKRMDMTEPDMTPLHAVAGADDGAMLKYAPCPDCPDGNVWNSKGPAGAICPTCGGTAYVFATLPTAGKEK